jgi:hypothetical protein
MNIFFSLLHLYRSSLVDIIAAVSPFSSPQRTPCILHHRFFLSPTFSPRILSMLCVSLFMQLSKYLPSRPLISAAASFPLTSLSVLRFVFLPTCHDSCTHSITHARIFLQKCPPKLPELLRTRPPPPRPVPPPRLPPGLPPLAPALPPRPLPTLLVQILTGRGKQYFIFFSSVALSGCKTVNDDDLWLEAAQARDKHCRKGFSLPLRS